MSVQCIKSFAIFNLTWYVMEIKNTKAHAWEFVGGFVFLQLIPGG